MRSLSTAGTRPGHPPRLPPPVSDRHGTPLVAMAVQRRDCCRLEGVVSPPPSPFRLHLDCQGRGWRGLAARPLPAILPLQTLPLAFHR